MRTPRRYEVIQRAVREGDFAYFREHPTSTSYVRPHYPGEFFPHMLRWLRFVRVERTARGTPIRLIHDHPANWR